jgi:plastocyanin
MRAIRRVSFAAVLVAAGVACGGSGGPTGPGGNTVTMGASSFSPTALTVALNATVTWQNGSGIVHNVTFGTAGAPADIPDHGSGSNARTFDTAGTFPYSCTIHAGMNGAITVQ